jgi:hypothetical protein
MSCRYWERVGRSLFFLGSGLGRWGAGVARDPFVRQVGLAVLLAAGLLLLWLVSGGVPERWPLGWSVGVAEAVGCETDCYVYESGYTPECGSCGADGAAPNQRGTVVLVDVPAISTGARFYAIGNSGARPAGVLRLYDGATGSQLATKTASGCGEGWCAVTWDSPVSLAAHSRVYVTLDVPSGKGWAYRGTAPVRPAATTWYRADVTVGQTDDPPGYSVYCVGTGVVNAVTGCSVGRYSTGVDLRVSDVTDEATATAVAGANATATAQASGNATATAQAVAIAAAATANAQAQATIAAGNALATSAAATQTRQAQLLQTPTPLPGYIYWSPDQASALATSAAANATMAVVASQLTPYPTPIDYSSYQATIAACAGCGAGSLATIAASQATPDYQYQATQAAAQATIARLQQAAADAQATARALPTATPQPPQATPDLRAVQTVAAAQATQVSAQATANAALIRIGDWTQGNATAQQDTAGAISTQTSAQVGGLAGIQTAIAGVPAQVQALPHAVATELVGVVLPAEGYQATRTADAQAQVAAKLAPVATAQSAIGVLVGGFGSDSCTSWTPPNGTFPWWLGGSHALIDAEIVHDYWCPMLPYANAWLELAALFSAIGGLLAIFNNGSMVRLGREVSR